MKKNQIFEEKMQYDWASFFDADLVVPPNTIWRRFADRDNRYYYAEVDGKVVIGIGITTAIDRSSPEPYALREWKNSTHNWQELLPMYANYGTLLHMAFEQLLTEKEVSANLIEIADENFDKKTDFLKDLLSLKKFVIDYNVKPLFIEGILGQKIIVGDNEYYICSAIDLVCIMDYETKTKALVEDGEYVRGDKKGQKKYKEETKITTERVMAVVDLKSNFTNKEQKSFFDSHREQLIFGRKLVCSHFSVEEENVKIFNISPLGWKSEPKYNLHEHVDFKNETGFTSEQVLLAKINLAIMMGNLKPGGNLLQLPETIRLDSSIENDFKYLSYEEKAESMLETIKSVK